MHLGFRRGGPSAKGCDGKVFFTMVRDPIATFVSGWMQVWIWFGMFKLGSN